VRRLLGTAESPGGTGNGLATLVRQGRVSGIVSRAILNRLQRDGVHVRMFLAFAWRDGAVRCFSRR
jgi:hypothetical protein